MLSDTEKRRVQDDSYQLDAEILCLFWSHREEDQLQGMIELLTQYTDPIRKVLWRRAIEGREKGLRYLLDPNTSCLREDLFEEVLQEAAKVIWEMVRARKFKPKKGLTHYVIGIVKNVAKSLQRKRFNAHKKIVLGVEPEEVGACRAEGGDLEMLREEISRFLDTLSAKNRIIVEVGVELSENAAPYRFEAREFYVRIVERFGEQGWTVKSETAVVRQYRRYRAKLRKTLRERGYYVP